MASPTAPLRDEKKKKRRDAVAVTILVVEITGGEIGPCTMYGAADSLFGYFAQVYFRLIPTGPLGVLAVVVTNPRPCHDKKVRAPNA